MNSSLSHLEAILRLDLQIPQQKTWRQRNIRGYQKGLDLEPSQISNINEKNAFGQLLPLVFGDREGPWRGGTPSHQKVGKGVIYLQAIEFLKQYILGSLMLVKPDVQAS